MAAPWIAKPCEALSGQYTIRKIPPELGRATKARVEDLGRSVNQVAIEALAASVAQPIRRRGLRGMAGAWFTREAAEFDRFLQEHRSVDDEVWKASPCWTPPACPTRSPRMTP